MSFNTGNKSVLGWYLKSLHLRNLYPFNNMIYTLFKT